MTSLTTNDGVAVSVVVPVHNRTGALRSTLLSLQRQTLADERFELILVDDGSVEPMEPHVADLLGRGPAITTLRNEVPLGAPAARNLGAELACGELLLFLDAECVAHPDLLGAHLRAYLRRPAAYCSNTSAREVTPEQWRVLLGADWDFADAAALFARVEQTPLLHDPLVNLLSVPHSTDWAYFWTTAASVPTDAFRKVGGFDTGFEVKGVEDMELAFRLARAGLPTLFLPDARCLHQPHERRRHMEVVRDRRNDHVLLATHPSPAVEIVVGFGVSAARTLDPIVARFSQRLQPASADCARLADIDAVVRMIYRAGPETLLLGHPNHWPEKAPRPGTVVFPMAVDNGWPIHQLIGVRLPYANATFALGVVTDYWRHFPERLQARIFDELLRTCREVVMLSHVSTAPTSAADPELATAIAHYDRPYWEFTVRLRREWHEFEFELLQSAGGASAFRVTGRPWPSTDLAATLEGLRLPDAPSQIPYT